MKLAAVFIALVLVTFTAGAAPVVLSTNGSSPTIAAAANSMAVLWQEENGLHHGVVDLSGGIVRSDTLPQSATAGPARVASDGQGYLMAWIDTADATIRVAMLDESGMHGPTLVLSAGARADVAPVITWDGTRYIVFWSATDQGVQSAHFAEVSAQGVELGDVKTLAGVPAVASAISSNGSTTIVWTTIDPTSTPGISSAETRLATVANGAVSSPTTVTKHVWVDALNNAERDQSLSSIGNQLFVSWVSPRMGSLTGVVGTRVSADGVPLDFSQPNNPTSSGKVIYFEFSQAVSAQLRSFSVDSQYVLVWRAGNRELIAHVEPDGTISTPTRLMEINNNDVLNSSDVAHLSDGRFAIAYELGRSHRVQLLFTLNEPGPKRRAVR